MRVTYDKEADAAYIYLDDEHQGVALTVSAGPFVNIDLDRKDNPVGIEILFATDCISEKAVESLAFYAALGGDLLENERRGH